MIKTKRYRYASELSSCLQRITQKVYKKQGFSESRIITDWPLIVGDKVAQYCTPVRLAFHGKGKNKGVLHVEVYQDGIATNLLFLEPVILEKLASYLGYKAIEKIKLIHHPKPITIEAKKDSKPASLDKDALAMLDELTANVKDEALAQSLRKLGERVISG